MFCNYVEMKKNSTDHQNKTKLKALKNNNKQHLFNKIAPILPDPL